MTIYLDPAGQHEREVLTYSLRADSSKPLRAAVISNGFPDSDRFRDILSASLREQLPDLTVKVFEKADPSALYSDAELATLNDCDVVAIVFGHCGGCTTGIARDVTILTELGIPNVAVITSHFWDMFKAVLDYSGVRSVPAVEVPYPMQGRDDADMSTIAGEIAPSIVALWSGESLESVRWAAA